mmetsp:Transcript_2298/g.4921  ORF Transcript_2298/g.4921 Transcript_2298/m.4921 type:complete len:209 (+) Transcript_2298:258-884(+)
MTKLTNEYGENVLVRFPTPFDGCVFLNEPKAIADVLDLDPEKTPVFFRGLDAVAPQGILGQPKAEWQRQRKLVGPSLSERVVGSMSLVYEEEPRPLYSRFEAAAESGALVEMDEEFVSTFMGIIGRVIIGRSFGMGNERSATVEGRAQIRDEDEPISEAIQSVRGRAHFSFEARSSWPHVFSLQRHIALTRMRARRRPARALLKKRAW